MVERHSCKVDVVGSIPTTGSIFDSGIQNSGEDMGFQNEALIQWKETEDSGSITYFCRVCERRVCMSMWRNTDELGFRLEVIDNNCKCCEDCYGAEYATQGWKWRGY